MVATRLPMGHRTYPGYLPASTHVPDAMFDADLATDGTYEFDFGNPDVSTNLLTALITAQAMTAAGTLVLENKFADARAGRNLLFDASGASTGTVTVKGFDYMGQRMVEQATLNGTTAVVGVKAFFQVTEVSWTATDSVNLILGWGARLGLPFRTDAILAEHLDGVAAAHGSGTLTAGVLTDPATATSGDPRGLWTPASTLAAAKSLSGVFRANRQLYETTDADGNAVYRYGLHGVRHYYA